MKRPNSPKFLVAVSAIVVVIIDQVTKSMAQADLSNHGVHLIGPLSLQLLYNSGIAFSLGTGDTALATTIEVIVLLGLLIYVRKIKSFTTAIGFGLVIGGALGNIADRVFRHNNGAVIDFIHTGFWPTFNLADTAVVVGIAVILLGSRSKSLPNK